MTADTDPREWIAQAQARCDAGDNTYAADPVWVMHAMENLPRALAALRAVLAECESADTEQTEGLLDPSNIEYALRSSKVATQRIRRAIEEALA